ncbi:serine hydrolase domain-containing protein [Spirosoma sp. SC4-14]|uniref:serine hydrolase domain-containing protein n=1 Tax=Spirosoma sp. SC4-14 TaxID=3128900 RepID=UPI0030D4960F
MSARLLTVWICTIASYAAQAQVHSVAQNPFEPVDWQIQQWVDKGYYSGASLLLVKDNELVLERYFGNYTSETSVFIASAGKWLAAATIAAVVDEGKLSWDDKVVKWLPGWTDVKGQATLRQLLSHTAGYPDYQPEGRHPDDYQSLTEAVSHIKPLPADATPGLQFRYGGLAMQVAGRMAELASGKEWEDLFQAKIARPLGMTATHFTPVDPTGGHNPMLGGGARSTLHDYAHFLDMIYHNGVYGGKRILSSTAVAEMQADQVGEANTQQEPYLKKAYNQQHNGIYGLGEWRAEIDSRGKPTLITSPSWAGAYPWIDQPNHIYGFFLAHVDVNGPAVKDHFNAFYASPLLPMLVRNAVKVSGKTK